MVLLREQCHYSNKYNLRGRVGVDVQLYSTIRIYILNGEFHFVIFKNIMSSIETVNKTTSKMDEFILEFHNTKFYFVSLVVSIV
jgi:hypothetical protein